MKPCKGILWAVAPQDAILAIVQPRFTERVFAHHMTVAFGVTREEVEDLIGKELKARIVGTAYNDEIQALIVDPPMWVNRYVRNKHPHITISSNGCPPVRSNDMLDGPHERFTLEDYRELPMKLEWSPFN